MSNLEEWNQYDFTFIPYHLVPQIPSRSFDIVCNTHSLGEMPQEIVLEYMQLIQERLAVRYLYSANRYLEKSVEGMKPVTALPIDNRWETLHWEFCPQHTRIDRAFIPTDLLSTLEYVGLRLHNSASDSTACSEISQQHYRAACEAESVRGQQWHYHMWESIRYQAQTENLSTYVEFLGNASCQEYTYYANCLKNLGGKLPPVRPDSFYYNRPIAVY